MSVSKGSSFPKILGGEIAKQVIDTITGRLEPRLKENGKKVLTSLTDASKREIEKSQNK